MDGIGQPLLLQGCLLKLEGMEGGKSVSYRE